MVDQWARFKEWLRDKHDVADDDFIMAYGVEHDGPYRSKIEVTIWRERVR